MTSDAIRPPYVSHYAPFDSDSALPPGLDERVVANSYKATRVMPKRVLLELGIRRYTGTAATRLRKALDDPAARARLNRPRSKVLPLHRAIYSLLRDDLAYRPVYKRIVEPAEVVRQASARPPVILLDPLQFEAQVTADQEDCSWSHRELTPQSEAEGLALFALAYGLLQLEDAQAILTPVLAIGPSFRSFFGATDDVPLPRPLRAPTAEHPSPREACDASSPQQTASDAERPSKIAIASAQHPRAGSDHVILYRGTRTQSVRKAISALDTHRATRRSLGNAHLLDEPAFSAAHKRELAAIAEIKKLTHDLQAQWESTTRHYSSLAQEYGISLRFEARPNGPEDAATSLDHLESDGTELLRLVAALQANATRAQTIGATLPPVHTHQDTPLELSDTIRSLTQYLSATSTALERAQQWQKTRKLVRDQLQDCASVHPAKSLGTISPEDITALLEHSLVNSDWDTLRPLLLRLWSERFTWSGPGASAILTVLMRALETAAARNDLDLHAEQLSYLERDTLQDLLGTRSASLARHVVLATFRESLTRHDSFFLTAIWGFERGWTSRSTTVGDRLQRFFSKLYRCFVHSKSAPLAMSFLVPAGSGSGNDPSDGIVAATAQDATDVAAQIEGAGRAPGLFGRLRLWSMTHHFKPIASAIREQRRAEVVGLFADLRRQLESGKLTSETVAAVGSRNVRADHRQSLARYVDDQLALVSSWLTRTAPEGRTPDDFALGSESAELRRLAAQLASGATRQSDPSLGSISWLESQIGRLLGRLARGEVLVQSPVWLGNVHLRPPPTHVRSWAAYTNGSLKWSDLLQDHLTELVLDVQRTLLESVRVLGAGGHLDAAVAAAETSERDDGEVRRALESLQELRLWRDGRVADIEALYARLDALDRGSTIEQRTRIAAVQSDLITALDDVDARDRNATQHHFLRGSRHGT